jgi:hypothetical protein
MSEENIKEPQIIKFGEIFENEDKKICFKYFHVDCIHLNLAPSIILIDLIIKRLQEEKEIYINNHGEI